MARPSVARLVREGPETDPVEESSFSLIEGAPKELEDLVAGLALDHQRVLALSRQFDARLRLLQAGRKSRARPRTSQLR
ncbi:MAG: hypothetical protein AB1445_11180 [Bacillota bacterium]